MSDKPTFNRGDRVMLDRSLKVEFVRHVAGTADSIVTMAGGSHAVPTASLSAEE